MATKSGIVKKTPLVEYSRPKRVGIIAINLKDGDELVVVAIANESDEIIMADASKVCIYGGSFGGYAAMMNPILNPGMYKCAIGYAGVYDIKADSAMKDASKQIRSYWSRTRGDEAIQTEQSPLTHLAKLDVPILLIHGKSDHNVDFDQFQAAEAALRRSGKTYEVFVKADEGHGFYKAADVEAAYNRMPVSTPT